MSYRWEAVEADRTRKSEETQQNNKKAPGNLQRMDEAKEEETINEKERRKEGENTETSRRARTTTKPVRINNHPTSPTTTAPSRPKNRLV